jgi:CRISPR-associated protein Cmr4
MKTNLLYLFTRTPLHVGAGSSVGAVDQPVIRERHTGFPIIPGSSIKGVLRDFSKTPQEGDEVFGLEANSKDEQDAGHAGALGFSEAKLLLFPVRSAKGGYTMTTCPLALARYARDAQVKYEIPQEPETGHCLANKTPSIQKDGKSSVVLEEYAFAVNDSFPEAWSAHLSEQIQDPVLQDAKDRFVLLSNEDFAHFAQNACQVLQHNRIDTETGTVEDGALFNEETVPAETLFYVSLNHLARNEAQEKALDTLFAKFADDQLIQFGGNATTGLGFCTCSLMKKEDA